ncbi:unnamed protein product [Thelazia callipaeda]|uniref:Zinc transporter ZIP3 n=1 Tax=Thelazia callipaeda TaxID=103827 RepID=A0A0N5CY36_THECL|nr:unnamed protein product [Thelazia callipaeda]
MSILVTKIVMLAVMNIAALVFGFLPLKIYKYVETKQKTKSSDELIINRLLTMLSCLSGGVFLGVCLLDLLPVANEAFEQVKQQLEWKATYPYTELLIGSGFFLVYLLEVLSAQFCKHSHVNYEVDDVECKHSNDGSIVFEQGTSTDIHDGTAIENKNSQDSALNLDISDNDNYVKSVTLVLAFSIHSSLEGFAFGVQQTMFSVTALFLGIIVHKSIVTFSIGMTLVKTHSKKLYFVLFLVVIVSLTAPIGGLVGILLESADIGDKSQNTVTAIATSIANGTFLYITFFEILFVEQVRGAHELEKWLSTLIGFVIIAVLMFFEPSD